MAEPIGQKIITEMELREDANGVPVATTPTVKISAIYPPTPEPPSRPGAFVPDVAKKAGLDEIAHWCGFDKPEEINLKGGFEPGVTQFTQMDKGNIFSSKLSDTGSFAFRDGVFYADPDNTNYQGTLISTEPRGQGKFDGFALRGLEERGWYFECRVKHEKAKVGQGFYAAWLYDLRHAYNFFDPEDYVNGIATFMELDVYEFINGGDTRSVHVHYRDQQARADKKMVPPKQRYSSIEWRAGLDPTQWHTYGLLVKKDPFSLTWYLDGEPCRRDKPYDAKMIEKAMQKAILTIIVGSGEAHDFLLDYTVVCK